MPTPLNYSSLLFVDNVYKSYCQSFYTMSLSAKEQAFINRLTEITTANLKNEQFGVSELAKELGISRSNLYLKIHQITNESVSCFIRTIRLQEAAKLLKTADLTVSEVAYEVGFGSPSYFIKCFHDYYGFSPGEVGKVESPDDPSVDTQTPKQETTFRESSRKSKILTTAVMLLILLASSVVVVNPFSSTKKFSDRSIAVLPFKNLSEDKGNQYFADGIVEDIVHSLSPLSGLRVISVTSSQQYRNTDKSLAEIARELGVSYVIEGSVQKEENKVKITIQFNDAKKDKLIWSDSFSGELKHIFDLQSTIATKIAKKLETVLTPKEQDQINKKYTDNAEAYDLYLEGRFYYRLRTKESFEKSIELYKQALTLDSNFCLAYAGLADSYVTSTWAGFIPREKGIPESRGYALKALSIDNDLAEAHATLGGIATYFDYNWDAAEKELKLALKLNPGYTRTYKLYAEYMDITGRMDEARKYINKALELNPSYQNMIEMSLYFYRREGMYNNAFRESKRLFELQKNQANFHYRNFSTYLSQHQYIEAISEYKKFISQASPDKNYQFLNDTLSASDAKNAVRSIIEIEKEKNIHYYDIALHYAILGEIKSAQDYLEMSYQKGEGRIVRMKYEKAFEDLKNEPRFIELLRKMNLTDEQLKHVTH